MFDEVARELIRLFRRGVDASLDEAEFQELAGRVFRYQFEHNPTYAEFCRRGGVDPAGAPDWTEIPPVPARAFKSLFLVSGPESEVEVVFRTSGTSRGVGERGRHPVLDLSLYRESLLPNFRAHLLPRGARLPLISLIPSPSRAPDSSLSRMIGEVEAQLAAPGGGYFVDPDRGIREEKLRRTLERFQEEDRPVLVTATAFALVHWMDALDREGRSFDLPGGSRIMETGGFKGRSRTVTRGELYASLEERLGVPAGRIVNEYGMTELLSQFYEPVLHEAAQRSGRDSGNAEAGAGRRAFRRGRAPSDRRLVSPPWVRTRVVDPITLEPVSRGEEGLLCHLDLANLGSVSAVLTEDRGIPVDGGFRVCGRVTDADPRGCSLAMDELLGAAEP